MLQDLSVGARYSSFKDLEAAVDKFSRDTNSVYIVNHSRSVELENKLRPSNKQIPKHLKYKNIRFACKHYGKTRSNSRGLRPNQSSFKIGCPSFIYVSANTKELVVEKLEAKHSHSCDPELVLLYPERRSLAHARRNERGDGALKNVREDVLDLLSLGVERRRILNYVWITANRKLFSGDLANIAKDLKDSPRDVSEQRSNALLEQLKSMESKQNGGSFKSVTKPLGLKAVKRKVPFSGDTIIKSEALSNDDSSEQCYSVIEGDQGEQVFNDSTMYISDMVSDENIHGEEIEYHYENQEEASESGGNVTNAASWSENSSLADVVKSILGPNQEGPVILHVNNYDGVAVVQIAEPHSSTAAEAQERKEDLEDQAPTSDTPAEHQPITRLIVKKTLSSKKPLVVTAMSEDPNKKSQNSSARENLLKSAQLKQVDPMTIQKNTVKFESNDDNFSEDDSDDPDDTSDAQSDHRSVLEEERTMYRVKTKKIRLQIHTLKNSIERQDLEKRKLQLEIKLLKMQVDEKELEAKQRKKVQDKQK